MAYDQKPDLACHNYVLLKPKEATFTEIFRLLFSTTGLNKRSFVECSEEEGTKHREFSRRWIIFVSILIQKLLLLVRKPMALIGFVLEWWLNFVASNGGLIALLRTIFKGDLVTLPVQSSSASIVGNLDPRMDLDKDIKPDDENYLSSISIMAAKLSYENEYFIKNVVLNNWKMHFLGFYNFWNGYLEKPSTPAFMFQNSITNPNLIVVAFRGTDPFDADAWRTDFDISWYDFQNAGKIHGGFIKALGLQNDNTWPSEIDQQRQHKNQQRHNFAYYEIKRTLNSMLSENKDAKFVVTGHSLGGALAILFVAGLAIHNEELLLDRLDGVYTFGQPRVGDEKFGTFVKRKLEEFDVKYRRYVYSFDIVPRIPYDDRTFLFKHFGPCLYFNSLYNGKVLEEEPDKNYFSLIWLGPKYLTGLWELIRGFIIPHVKGVEYKECWFMRALRLFGLVIPGISAHIPFDYVNLTRIGSLPNLKKDPQIMLHAVSKLD